MDTTIDTKTNAGSTEARPSEVALDALVGLLRQACEIYRDASFQSHTGHWDPTMQHGAGCPECIRARELRAKADAIMEQANTTGEAALPAKENA